MIDFLFGLGELIFSLIAFVNNTLNSVFWVITNIGSFVTSLTSVFAYCPTFLLVWLELSVALTVLFAVLKLI